MKRVIVVLAMMLLLVVVAYGIDARIDVQTGSIDFTFAAADSTGFITSGFTPIQISEMPGGSQTFADRKYDAFLGTWYLNTLTQDTGSTTIGTGDTLIIRVQFKTGSYVYTAAADTGTMPCTLSVFLYEDLWLDPTAETWIGGDSTSAYAYLTPNMYGDLQSFYADQFQIEYYVADSAGTTSQLSGSIQYEHKWFDLPGR